MGSTTHTEDEKHLGKDVHRLARLGMRLGDSTSGGVQVILVVNHPCLLMSSRVNNSILC